MECIVIKMNNEFYPEDGDIEYLLKYIAGETKNKEITRYFNGRGLPRDCRKAAKSIIKVQRACKKANQRRLYQLFISFPAEIDDANCERKLNEKAFIASSSLYSKKF